MNDIVITTETLASALQAGGALTDDYQAVWEKLWQQSHIPAGLLELCRLRLAQMHRVTAELELRRDVDLDPAKVQDLVAGKNLNNGRFSEGELAALELAELYAMDPAAITDEVAASVKQHFGEPGLVCLVEALGFIEGRIRLALMFSALRATASH